MPLWGGRPRQQRIAPNHRVPVARLVNGQAWCAHRLTAQPTYNCVARLMNAGKLQLFAPADAILDVDGGGQELHSGLRVYYESASRGIALHGALAGVPVTMLSAERQRSLSSNDSVGAANAGGAGGVVGPAQNQR